MWMKDMGNKLLQLTNWKTICKNIILETVRIVEHNPEHYITVSVWGEEIKACSRCLGTYLASSILFIPFLYLSQYNIIKIEFWTVIIISYLLASVTIFDFLTVELNKRKGNNKIRFIAGTLLGISGMTYFFFLPKSWFFRIGTLIMYCFMALGLAFITEKVRRV